MSDAHRTRPLDLPANVDLPFFVYGALKPGFPAFEFVRDFVQSYDLNKVTGALLVRDGLPLLTTSGHDQVLGYLLKWKPNAADDGYAAVCAFEPRKHYEWAEVKLPAEVQANVLVVRSPKKGNPRSLGVSSWRIVDDPAFGPGLKTVREVFQEVDSMPTDSFDSEWNRFFRSQMAYLLLWSILERLSALCFGAALEPMQRIKRLHQLSGMDRLVFENVKRTDTVTDSRNPEDSYKLDKNNPKKCFDYYYQVRSNLSHRGKGVFNDFNKVHGSLKELLIITERYIANLQMQQGSHA